MFKIHIYLNRPSSVNGYYKDIKQPDTLFLFKHLEVKSYSMTNKISVSQHSLVIPPLDMNIQNKQSQHLTRG